MREVLKLPAFRRLLAVSMINELALSIAAVALALLVYRRTGSAVGATAFFLCAEFGPALISPFFVSRLDQRSARRVLAVLYATQVVIFILLAWLVHRFAVAPVLALVLLSGSVAGTATVLVRAAWTSVTSAAGLVREANAFMNSGFSICFMVGPAIGGGLVALGGTVAALLVIVAVYAVSAVVMATASALPTPGTDRDRSAGRVWAAIRYARREPVIRRLLGLQAVGLVFFAISIPVEVVFAQHTLGAGPGGYGALLAAWGGGAILGSGLYARWRRLPSRTLIAIGTCALAAGFLVMAIAPSLSVAIIGAALAGVGNGVQIVSVRTALQEAVVERWMALILSLNQSMFQALPGLGIIIGGALMTLASTRAALAVGAGGSFTVALVMWLRLRILGPLPTLKPEVSRGEDPDVALPAVMRDG
jgi:ENTS family enterobactin (siderophore) exporter